MANEVLKLAYDTATATLRDQDATLTSLRNRATGLLGAVAIGTSFAAGVGLFKAEPGSQTTLPIWVGWSLLGLVIVIGTSVMVTLWPASDWKYGVQAGALLANAATGIDDVHRHAAEAMVTAAEANDKIVNRKFLAYRIGVFALILEVIMLIIGVIFV